LNSKVIDWACKCQINVLTKQFQQLNHFNRLNRVNPSDVDVEEEVS